MFIFWMGIGKEKQEFFFRCFFEDQVFGLEFIVFYFNFIDFRQYDCIEFGFYFYGFFVVILKDNMFFIENLFKGMFYFIYVWVLQFVLS